MCFLLSSQTPLVNIFDSNPTSWKMYYSMYDVIIFTINILFQSIRELKSASSDKMHTYQTSSGLTVRLFCYLFSAAFATSVFEFWCAMCCMATYLHLKKKNKKTHKITGLCMWVNCSVGQKSSPSSNAEQPQHPLEFIWQFLESPFIFPRKQWSFKTFRWHF